MTSLRFPVSAWHAWRMSHNQLELRESSFLLLPYDLYVNFYFFVCPLQTLLKEGVEKKKRALDVDVFTRFSFLNIFIIAQKKRKVNPVREKSLQATEVAPKAQRSLTGSSRCT